MSAVPSRPQPLLRRWRRLPSRPQPLRRCCAAPPFRPQPLLRRWRRLPRMAELQAAATVLFDG